MREPAQRFSPWVASALLGWCAWSGLSGGDGKQTEARKRPPDLPASRLARRAEGDALPSFRDPFFAEWAPYGPTWSPEYVAEQRRREAEAEKEAKRLAAEEEARRRRLARDAAEASRRRGPETVTLELDAVARLPEGDVARISGRTVRVGETVPGTGVEPAPLLVRVDGATAELSWADRPWTLRIDGGPTVLVRRGDDPSAESRP